MNRRRFVQGAGAAGLALVSGCGLAPAARPQAAKVHRIARLYGNLPNPASDALSSAFRQGLRDLGYVEGENLLIEERYADGADQLTDPAAEMVRLQMEVILVPTVGAALVVRKETSTIPIVTGGGQELVASGLVASLGRPGGNVTGLSTPFLGGKQLQLLCDAVPTLSHVAILYDRNTDMAQLDSTGTLASGALRLGIQLQWVSISSEDLESVFKTAVYEQTDGLIAVGGGLIVGHQARIAELAVQSQLPSIWAVSSAPSYGGLMAYAPNGPDIYRRAAGYVDKILKGAKPADLPIEQPDMFDFVINLKTAGTLGLTIPPSVLSQATEIIQ